MRQLRRVLLYSLGTFGIRLRGFNMLKKTLYKKCLEIDDIYNKQDFDIEDDDNSIYFTKKYTIRKNLTKLQLNNLWEINRKLEV